MNNLDPRIADAVSYVQEEVGKDFTVWARFGKGEGCQLYSMKMGISIELSLNPDGTVAAEPMFTVPGFSGFINGMKLCLPNSHLYRVVCQLETIKHFLPKDNINDHYGEVVVAHMIKERKRRRAERERIKSEQSGTDSSN
ncbi:hypothetical protein BN79_043 [Yersinia phage phiR2-01]|uniref:Phage protein n=1 Tax=Yersinia phage phiR2-01 TaxID=1206557 RepID=I7K2L8_9CAUD|nr:hypothetical protein BN79_043 [Yersinia phage phiR2-01]CCI88471.1 hypothetical protein BN79_043 [Yersinia phage phiR2-01]